MLEVQWNVYVALDTDYVVDYSQGLGKQRKRKLTVSYDPWLANEAVEYVENRI